MKDFELSVSFALREDMKEYLTNWLKPQLRFEFLSIYKKPKYSWITGLYFKKKTSKFNNP